MARLNVLDISKEKKQVDGGLGFVQSTPFCLARKGREVPPATHIGDLTHNTPRGQGTGQPTGLFPLTRTYVHTHTKNKT